MLGALKEDFSILTPTLRPLGGKPALKSYLISQCETKLEGGEWGRYIESMTRRMFC